MIKVLEIHLKDGHTPRYYGVYAVQNDAVGISFSDSDGIEYFYPSHSFKRVRVWSESEV